MNKALLVIQVSIFLVLSGIMPVKAQEDLAKKSQNPIGNMISLPFENNTYTEAGPSDKIGNVLNIKPVYPVNLGKINLLNRLVVPLIYLEGQDRKDVPARRSRRRVQAGRQEIFPDKDSVFGLGNIQYQAFFSPAKPGKAVWGIGPAFELPTNTDSALGSDKWSIGPTFVLLAMPGPWVVGCLTQNLWDFAGKSGDPNVNKFLFQYFINYNLKKGWYLSSTPVITANWEADSGEKWTVPLGGGIGRLVRFGKQPVDFKLASYWNAVKPRNGPKWNFQLTVKFLFPK
jgi:hypothetical protein